MSDYSNWHTVCSFIKSGLRIIGCAHGAFGSLVGFAALMGLAEVVGIIEELG